MLHLCLRSTLGLSLLCLAGCAAAPPPVDLFESEDGKPFSDSVSSAAGDTSEQTGSCGIFTCRYIAVGTPACADYYAVEGWNPQDAARDCKQAAAAVQTTTIDTSTQPSCIGVGAGKDGVIGGQCVIPGALQEFKGRTVYAYGMTEGLCTGIKDLEGVWQETPHDPCPETSGGGPGPEVTNDGGLEPQAPSDVYSCRTSALLGEMLCADYPSANGFTEAQAQAACSDANGTFSAELADACIDGGFDKRCKKPDNSYLYGVDSCDGLFGVLELLGAAQPPEQGPFAPYGAIDCGEVGTSDVVFSCRYEGFAPSCADYPAKEGWSEESAASHCKTLPNSKDHKMGGSTCLSEKKTDTTRCRIADPAVCDQVYYGYDIPDFVCSGGLIAGDASYETQPFDDTY